MAEPYDAEINVKCLLLRSEMIGGNIRLHMTLRINVGCLSFATEMNGGNIRLRMTLKINVGCLSQKRNVPFFRAINTSKTGQFRFKRLASLNIYALKT